MAAGASRGRRMPKASRSGSRRRAASRNPSCDSIWRPFLAHLIPQLTVIAEGREVAHGAALAELRRVSAAAAAAELERHAHAAYAGTGSWQRFELDALPDSASLATEQGTVCVYPTLAQRRGSQELEVRYEWSSAEARRCWWRSRRAIGAQDAGRAGARSCQGDCRQCPVVARRRPLCQQRGA